MVGDGHTRSAGLSVVDDGVDATELLNRLVDNVLHDGLVVLTSRDIGLNRQHLDAVLRLEGLLGGLELGNVAAGNDEVSALLGKCDIDAVADGASGAVLKRGLAAAGDDYGLTSEKSHIKSFQIAADTPADCAHPNSRAKSWNVTLACSSENKRPR